MIARVEAKERIVEALDRAPVCCLLGPRQCGKTTIARSLAATRESHYFDLESPRDLLRLTNPEMALEELTGLVVLDEIQERPDIFPVLRVLADRIDSPAKFLLLGSASPELIRRSSETLAGRVEFTFLHGFDLRETGTEEWKRLWRRGGFPRAYLAETEEDAAAWLESFIQTFLQRDLPQFGVNVPAPTMRRFWTMLAHSHGQLWNASQIGRSMSLTDKTVRSYLDRLSQVFMVRQIQPWYENLAKRQVKSPRIYLRDTGLLHSLLGIGSAEALDGHPMVGASWEGFALEQTLRLFPSDDAYFWRTSGGAELDLLLLRKGKRLGFEYKFSEKPSTTRSMRVAMEDLRLDHLYVVCPGRNLVGIDDRIDVCGIECLHELARSH